MHENLQETTLECAWHFKVEVESRIEMTALRFELDTAYDFWF